MGAHPNITHYRRPRQGGLLGIGVLVAFHYDTSLTQAGTVIRDDVEDPGETLIRLDDGFVVRAAECQFRIP